MKLNVIGGSSVVPSSSTDENCPPPLIGKPRTLTRRPATPPLDSTYVPGTFFNTSAVLSGAICCKLSALIELIEKPASSRCRPLARGVPVTITSSIDSLAPPLRETGRWRPQVRYRHLPVRLAVFRERCAPGRTPRRPQYR